MMDGDKDEQITLDDVLNQTLDAALPPRPAVEAETIIEPSETEEAKAERERDERGRFKAKDGDDAPKEIAEPVAEKAPAEPVESADAKPENAQPEEARPAFTEGHFRGWSPEQKEKFATLAPEAQDLVIALKRDTDAHYTRKLEEAAHLRKAYEPIAQTLNELTDIAAAQGMDPAGVVQSYAAIEKVLTYGRFDEKVNLIGQICQKFGIPFAPQDQLQALDPNTVQNFSAIHDRDAELARVRAEAEATRRQLRQFEAQSLQTQIETFQTATNPDGSPKYPYFQAVKATMGSLLASRQAQSLEDAYQKAAAPITQAIEAQTAAAKHAAEAANRSAVERAKKAAPVKASTSAPRGNVQPAKSLDDVLNSAFDAVGL